MIYYCIRKALEAGIAALDKDTAEATEQRKEEIGGEPTDSNNKPEHLVNELDKQFSRLQRLIH